MLFSRTILTCGWAEVGIVLCVVLLAVSAWRKPARTDEEGP